MPLGPVSVTNRKILEDGGNRSQKDTYSGSSICPSFLPIRPWTVENFPLASFFRPEEGIEESFAVKQNSTFSKVHPSQTAWLTRELEGRPG